MATSVAEPRRTQRTDGEKDKHDGDEPAPLTDVTTKPPDAPTSSGSSPQSPPPQSGTSASVLGTWGLRAALLTALVAQFATHTFLMRYSRGVLHENYAPAAVVFFVELLKFSACAFAVTFVPSAVSSSGGRGVRNIPRLIADTPPLILIPATSYFVQNVLSFVALKYLQPSVFVVLSQLKILSTTVFSTLLLRRRFNAGHWRSLVLLVFATILVDPSSQSSKSAATATAASQAAGFGGVFIGVAAVLVMASLSGFSSAVLELVLKGSPSVTIWERNLQLASCSMVLALVTVTTTGAVPDLQRIASLESFVTLTAAALSAFGGIIVALIMRYADNIVKCFATAVGICVTSSLSVVIFHEAASRLLMIGIGLVTLSILNYNAEPAAVATGPIPAFPNLSGPYKILYLCTLGFGVIFSLFFAMIK